MIAPQSTASKVLRPPATTVTIESTSVRDEYGLRIWFRKRREADKVIAAFFSRCQEAQRRRGGDGLVVKADVATVEAMVRSVAHSLGFTVTDDAMIDQQLALITQRISDALPRVTKGLSKQYKAARASGAPLPRYDLWLIERLKPAIRPVSPSHCRAARGRRDLGSDRFAAVLDR